MTTPDLDREFSALTSFVGGQTFAFGDANLPGTTPKSWDADDSDQGVESLASLPSFTTHVSVPPEDRRRAGIGDGLIRISVGLEGPGRILEDLHQALRAQGT